MTRQISTSDKKNPIEQRLDFLTSVWKEFTQNPKARLLRWKILQEDRNMLDTFFEVQNQEAGSDLRDLFVKFQTPFSPDDSDASANEYGCMLVDELEKQYAEIKESLAQEGIDNTWSLPPRTRDSSGVGSLIFCCNSFQKHYKEIIEHFVLVLVPSSISDPKRWQEWLETFLCSDIPESIRATIVDNAEVPTMEEIASEFKDTLMTADPKLDMPGAMKEIASSAGSGPGAEFRRIFVDMAMSKSQNPSVLQGKADQALQIARANNWPSLQVAVYLLLGATHFKDGRSSEALTCYEAAKQLSQSVDPKVDPSGARLAVQSTFGKAAVLFSSGQYSEAAKEYEEAAEAAKNGQDYHMATEALRMASYCYEQDKRTDEAWSTGWRALDVSEKIEEKMRMSGGTTLPFLGQALLRITNSDPRYENRIEDITTRMNELVGTGWRDQTAHTGGERG
jgi:tetratricopeptide (TPR) repeat protein